MSTQFNTPIVQIAFPNLFVPKLHKDAKPDDSPLYSCELLLPPKVDLMPFKKAIQAEIEAKWPDIKTRPKNLKNPVRPVEGNREGYKGYEEGHFCSAKSKTKPAVLFGPQKEVLTDSERVYPGAYVVASLSASAFSFSGSNGIKLFLNAIWLIRDGERLVAARSSSDDFNEYDLDPEAFGFDTMFT